MTSHEAKKWEKLTNAFAVRTPRPKLEVLHATETDVVRLDHGVDHPVLEPQTLLAGVSQKHVLDDDALDRYVSVVSLFRVRRSFGASDFRIPLFFRCILFQLVFHKKRHFFFVSSFLYCYC